MLNELLKGLLGLDLDQEISRLISRYGYDAVNEAVVDQGPKPKRGRKVIEDWPEILPIISADALSWLAGQDPFRERSNYSIAKQIADKLSAGGHSDRERALTSYKTPRLYINCASPGGHGVQPRRLLEIDHRYRSHPIRCPAIPSPNHPKVVPEKRVVSQVRTE